MDDKNVMENILLLEKGVCDLYMHGTIESCTSNVHQAFSHALSDSLAMQDTLYDQMAAKGWYPTDRAEMTKIQAVKKKFSPCRADPDAKKLPYFCGSFFHYGIKRFSHFSENTGTSCIPA